MQRRKFLTGLGALPFLANSKGFAMPDSKPNFMFICVDDLAANSVGFLGSLAGTTPNMDSLAAKSLVFTNAHCVVPECKPSRVSFLWGASPQRTGAYTNGKDSSWQRIPYCKHNRSFPKQLHDSGYQSFGAGKIYHSAHVSPNIDADFEWTHSYYPHDGIKSPNTLRDFGVRDYDYNEHFDHKVADRLISQIENRDLSSPFFAFAGFYYPHQAFQPAREFYERVKSGAVQHRYIGYRQDLADLPKSAQNAIEAHYANNRLDQYVKSSEITDLLRCYHACVAQVDDAVGRLLTSVENIPNTYVVLFSDNGQFLGDKGMLTKFLPWKSGSHVPLLIAGPNVRPARTNQPVSIGSLAPTVLNLSGLPKLRDYDFPDLTRLIDNPFAHQEDIQVYAQIQHGDYSGQRVVKNVGKNRTEYIWPDGREWYNTRTDPFEINNLNSQHRPHFWKCARNIVNKING